MLQTITRVSPQAARYTLAGSPIEHCSLCRFYVARGSNCLRIMGRVSLDGWCKYFSREMVQPWQAPGGNQAGGVAGPAVDLNFTAGSLPTGVIFTRGSTATYFDVTGTLQGVTGNTPRFDYDPVAHTLRGLLIEETRTNLLLNTAVALVTQSVAVTAQPYTLSFYGTGTITKSGTASGALVGTGAFPARVTQTFTPTAGTLTLTVTGSVLNAQLEAGSFPTSWITTAGAAVTRAPEVCSMPLGGWYVQQLGTLAVEALQPVLCSKPVRLLQVEYSGAQAAISISGANSINMYDSASALNVAIGAEPVGTVFKAAYAYANGAQSGVLNAAAPVTGAAATLGTGMTTMGIGCQAITSSLQPNAWIRRARYWPRALSTAELQAVTT